MASTSTASRHFGHIIKEHTLEVTWDPSTEAANAITFDLFAREIYAPGNEDVLTIVYLQGGPGFPAPRPVGASGVIGEALKEFRVILLDQRGTGCSHRINAASIADIPAARLAQLRQEYIIEDAEALRKHLGIAKWSLYGQFSGGFCITSHLSRYPESVEHAYLTGGLPVLDRGADGLYRTTYAKLRTRHERFYREYPWAENRIREIYAHLEQSAETPPTGERLSPRRFRIIGTELGREDGFHNLAYLLKEPFRIRNGEKQLHTDFLADVGFRVSFADGPLYAAIHESIYGGVGSQPTTNWAAHHIHEEIPGLEEKANPTGGEPFYLTGEHIFPWQFEEDPAPIPFREKVEALAQHTWESSPYDSTRLPTDAPTSAAAVYLDDIFVPFEYSMKTANCYRDLRPHVTNVFQHDDIRHDDPVIFARFRELIEDH